MASFLARSGIVLWLVGVCALLAAATPAVPSGVKPAAVIYINDGTSQSRLRADRISHMINELESFYHIPIERIVLENESALPRQIERIADKDIGLVLIIAPQDRQALMKLPGLYPDISFSIIGVETPLYLTNVRSMYFREQEGTFMMGVLSALRTRTGTVSFVSTQDTPTTRNLAYAFLQGAKHANPEIKVIQKLGEKALAEEKPGEQPDITFVYDESLLEKMLPAAQKAQQLLITNDHDLTSRYPEVVLTSLLKHYDLAMYQTFRSYSRGEWKPGTQSLGIGSGFIDYALSATNKNLIPKETIEQMETTKDFVAQGVVQVNTLVQ